ncbi:hypothetical protein [Carnobacterium jeotgali]|uniref:hypothetical protein n=1 Tax=Carnobacterium jeotgali TaxID=545534 RepID=UPI003890493B
MGDYSVDIFVTHLGEDYTIISDLDVKGHEWYLAVKSQDVKEEVYPIQTYVIPRNGNDI